MRQIPIIAVALAALLVLVSQLGSEAQAGPGPQPAQGINDRLDALEKWKESAERRITALEGRGGQPVQAGDASAAESIISAKLTRKKYDPANTDAAKFESHVSWDAIYSATGLKKEARSIKGVLLMCDLFGDPGFKVSLTIDEPLKPGAQVTIKGVGIVYNQFRSEHKWLRSTSIDDMSFRFVVSDILYKDGTREEF